MMTMAPGCLIQYHTVGIGTVPLHLKKLDKIKVKLFRASVAMPRHSKIVIALRRIYSSLGIRYHSLNRIIRHSLHYHESGK